MVRVGTVSSVDVENRTARVKFADKNNLVSGPLKVIQNQPLIVYKKWSVDNSVEGDEPNTIKEIDITEEINPDYEAIYHSANQNLNINEKYAKYSGRIYEPDYIKNVDKTLIKVYPWLPYVGQLVLCIYLPNGESDGFVIGGI
ncbi:hypothetical protein [Tepidibacter thalassicus]|nr:hypothetical protein [Tepidibacter thalassicus]